jgi:hypothetical protein
MFKAGMVQKVLVIAWKQIIHGRKKANLPFAKPRVSLILEKLGCD